MKVLHLLAALLLLLGTAPQVFAQGIEVPATNDGDDVETTVLTIDDLTAGAEMETAPDQSTMKAHSMIEIGVRPSYMWVGGDVEAEAGYGAGFHVRKALDHIFSLRFDGLVGGSKGDNMRPAGRNRRFESDWASGTVFGVMTLNNFKWDGGVRKLNMYVMAGAGANWFESEFQDPEGIWQDGRNPDIKREFAPHGAGGAGIAYRISPRVNIGVEYQAIVTLGSRADLLDGYSTGSNFRDVQNVASLNLNFNLGNSAKRMEPRYWVNAFTPVREELDRVSSRIDDATTDSDGDGVVDAIDIEANTPAGVPVDTKGRTLDSDKDGVPDYRDLEPFFPPAEGESVDDNGVVLNRRNAPISEARVQEMIDASLARYAERDRPSSTAVRTNSGGEIFLPMIYFPINQATIRYSDYGTLSSVARVLQGNPGLRMVVRGYTDRTGNAANNVVLSYRRARAVVDHLVGQHGISRDRLILQYRGQDNAIVPLDKSVVNRRVEFLTGTAGESEDPAPAGYNGNQGGY